MPHLAIDTILHELPVSHMDGGNPYLAINLLTGTFSLVSHSVATSLLRGEINNASDDLIRRLCISDELSEEKNLICFYDCLIAAVQANVAPEIAVIPWYDCNFGCEYCWQRDFSKSSLGNHSLANLIEGVLREAEKYFARAGWKQRPRVTILGGEPLLSDEIHRAEFLAILRTTMNFTTTIAVITNGYYLDSYLEDMYLHGRPSLQVSVDGPGRVHDARRPTGESGPTFDRIWRNIGLALASGFTVSMRVNVDTSNTSSLAELWKQLHYAGWLDCDHFSVELAPVTHHCTPCSSLATDATSVLPRIYESFRSLPTPSRVSLRYWKGADVAYIAAHDSRLILPRFHYCKAAHAGQVAIAPNGLVFCCMECTHDAALAIGRWGSDFVIDDSSLGEWCKPVLEIAACRDCRSRLVCAGGCPLARLAASKEGYPYCENVDQQLSMSLDYYWPKIVLKQSK
jgi:uncharacterized protein